MAEKQQEGEAPAEERALAEAAPKPRSPIPPGTILIGKKPVMSYVTAIMMHFHGGAKELTIKARGRAISRAVDVFEVANRRFFGGKLAVKDVAIGTDIISEEGGDTRNVSTMEIKIEKRD
jgi:DNA-binding protein